MRMIWNPKHLHKILEENGKTDCYKKNPVKYIWLISIDVNAWQVKRQTRLMLTNPLQFVFKHLFPHLMEWDASPDNIAANICGEQARHSRISWLLSFFIKLQYFTPQKLWFHRSLFYHCSIVLSGNSLIGRSAKAYPSLIWLWLGQNQTANLSRASLAVLV